MFVKVAECEWRVLTCINLHALFAGLLVEELDRALESADDMSELDVVFLYHKNDQGNPNVTLMESML